MSATVLRILRAALAAASIPTMILAILSLARPGFADYIYCCYFGFGGRGYEVWENCN
jgi:hypothetical protein